MFANGIKASGKRFLLYLLSLFGGCWVIADGYLVVAVCWLGLIFVAYLLLLVGSRLLSVGSCFGRCWNSVFWLLLSVICWL
jgi:hypothetical protein